LVPSRLNWNQPSRLIASGTTFFSKKMLQPVSQASPKWNSLAGGGGTFSLW